MIAVATPRAGVLSDESVRPESHEQTNLCANPNASLCGAVVAVIVITDWVLDAEHVSNDVNSGLAQRTLSRG